MPAPKGNKFWEARATSGRKPIFDDPDKLWGMCVEYFEWTEDNPLKEMKLFAFQGTVTEHEVPKIRAMTIGALCRFLDINQDTWTLYRKREDFIGVTSRVDQVIRDQKFSGAAADLLNANIIARDLGLVDKSDTKHTGSLNVTMLPEDSATL